MNRFRSIVKLLVIATFVLAFASIAQAQATRTWVSGVGDDVNPCSRTAPCKTWAGAISKTATGGEIDALDPGGYGTLTITKSIIVDGTNGGAGWGSTLNSGGINGFVINDSLSATPNTAQVTLRNLSINGAGTTAGLNGIRFIAGQQLVVENVTIDNQSNHGIDITLSAVATGNQRAYFKNITIARVGGSGIHVANNVGVGGGVSVTIENVTVTQSGTGLNAQAKSRVFVKNSNFTNSTNNGVDIGATSFGVDLENCLIHSNGTNGIRAGGGTSRIANNYISNNTTAGVNLTGGTVNSYGDNKIDGNGTDVLGGALGGPTAKK